MQPRILCILFTVLLLTGCQQRRPVTVQVGNISAWVEVASTSRQRQRGLMYRRRLGPDEGLLMVFPEPQRVSLWMSNTLIPLDVGFFDRSGVLQSVVRMAPDGGDRLYHSPPRTRYALEMNQDWFQRHGLQPGVRLHLPGEMRAE